MTKSFGGWYRTHLITFIKGKKKAKSADAERDSVPSFQAMRERIKASTKATMSRLRSIVSVLCVCLVCYSCGSMSEMAVTLGKWRESR